MSKLFKIAGVSRLDANAGFKLRVANGKLSARQRILERNGHVDVQLFDLPQEMSKEKILAWLSLEKPSIAAKLDGKAPKVEVAPVPSEDAKLLLKRAKDAARKREKRAAEKAARAAGLAKEQAEIDAEYAIV